MQTPGFQEQIYRQVCRQIFALQRMNSRQVTGAKPFGINCLLPKIHAIDDVAELIVKNRQATDRTE